jgi:hypothetical protein
VNFIYDARLKLMQSEASAHEDMMEELDRILSLPEKDRNEKSAELKEDLFSNEDLIRVTKQPDPEAGEKGAFPGAVNIPSGRG